MKRFLLLAIISSLSAQYSFDVKTLINDKVFKGELRTIKQGVIHSIESSSWAEVRNFQEDYSLWIRRLSRTQINDSLIVKVLIQLRSPAMLTMGDFIDQEEIMISYHWEEIQTASDSVNKNIFKNKQGQSSEIISNLSSLAKTVGNLSGEPALNLLSRIPLSSLDLDNIIKYDPSPVAVLESLLIGQQTLDLMEDMVKKDKSSK